MRKLAKDLLPPLVVRSLRHRSADGLRFTGSPANWADALRSSSGYADPAILDRVVAATREVVAGHAAYERDSVLFHDDEVPLSVVAAILRSAVLDSGQVSVIDIGGSLGSTYRECRRFLAPLASLEWTIVEQRPFVEAGQREFTTSELRFEESLAAVPPTRVPATFLLSSVLQYLEAPHEVLRSITQRPSRHLAIDRTPVAALPDDRLCIQHAPRSVYDASYPAWIFSRERLMEQLEPDWRLVTDQPGADGRHETTDGLPFEFRTMIFERRA